MFCFTRVARRSRKKWDVCQGRKYNSKCKCIGTGFLRQEPRGIRSETRCQGQATGAVNILLKTPTCSTSVPVLRLLPANNQPSRQAFKFLSRCHLMGDGTEFGSLSLARSHHSYLWACKKENQRVRDLSVLEFSL